ncbi:hypothetical protein [Clostridium sp.]|uniref:hypothetical protein n=1 Tax=Clostridium sp. TaxID=1506 RepID=UPI0032173C19
MTGFNMNMFQKYKETEAGEKKSINEHRKISGNWKIIDSFKVTLISGAIILVVFLLLALS